MQETYAEDEDTGNVEESFDNRMKDNAGKYKTSLISIGPSEVHATSGAIQVGHYLLTWPSTGI